MKKIMMMAAVAAAVLTSCSNSELIELSDSRAIGFETYVYFDILCTVYNI